MSGVKYIHDDGRGPSRASRWHSFPDCGGLVLYAMDESDPNDRGLLESLRGECRACARRRAAAERDARREKA